MTDTSAVRIERAGDVGLIVIDNPPVNAVSPAVRDGIMEAVQTLDADEAIRAVVLIGAGKTFIAGADIRGMGGNAVRPLRSAQMVLDESAKPVVAAIHGVALGAGLEYAMSCHYRIASATAKVGLPEVRIGIIPGGGGTQRLPRLVGVEPALDMILSGRHVGADEARRLGILDEVVAADADLRSAAIDLARKVAAKTRHPRVRDRDEKIKAVSPDIFEKTRKSIARRARNQQAPFACIEAVEAAVSLPFDEGIARERAIFDRLEHSDEAKALRYAFFAEREAAKIPGLRKDVSLRRVASGAVIGAGTMGGGIAMALADAGIPVKIMDADPDGLSRGLQRIRTNYDVSVKRGSLAEAEAAERFARIEPVNGFDEIRECDVVIEAVFEDLEVKKDIFRKIDAVMKPGTLLLTNTSALDIDAIASVTERPGDVAGAHFFSPANVMKLLEVVRGRATSDDTLASVMRFGKALGKIPVASGNCDGFIANRSRVPFITEMGILLEEGALPEHVDKAMVDFGFPMGPFAVADLAGLELSYIMRQRRFKLDPTFRMLPISDRLVEMGRRGQKTGSGWYRYEPGDRTPHPDPEVAAIIRQMSAEMGVKQREADAGTIVRRLLLASIGEACRILEEGIAYRASDIDVMWLHGFGFPRYRGGLMFWADQLGIGNVYQAMLEYERDLGNRYRPPALLRKLAESGTPFADSAKLLANETA